MDDYVQKKLKRWSFARYIGIFRENGVSKNNFHLLTDDAIAGLIPSVVSRKQFLKKFNHLKMIKGIENTEVPTTSHSPELQELSSSSSHSLQKSAVSLHKTDLKALLMKNHAGQRIVRALQSAKAPTNFLRRRLAVFLFDNLLQSCDNNPSSEQKMELAKKIVEEFPYIYIQKKDEISENEQFEFQKESDDISNIENQMEIEIEPPSLPGSKQIPEGPDSCDFCLKETSLYIVCNGLCKLKFCNDCCGIADLKRLSNTAKRCWKCRGCRHPSTSSIHNEQKDGLRCNENSDVKFSESYNSVSDTIDPLQGSKQFQEGAVSCDFCSKEMSLYVACSGMCKLKFCNDCCGIEDLKRLSQAAKISWMCKSCQKLSTSSIHSEQKDGLSRDENSEVDVNSSESSDAVSNPIDPLQALEFYSSESTNETSEYSRCQNAGENYNEVSNISSYRDVNSDTTHSGTLALICCEEPIIKKEPDLSYDNMATIELPAPTEMIPIDYSMTATSSHRIIEMTPIDYSMAATSSHRIIGNEDKSVTTNKKLKKTNVKTILKKSTQGRKLLSSMEHGDITPKTQSRLARILVKHLVDRHGLYFPVSMLKSVALAITKQLPLLSEVFGGHEVWYSEETVEEGVSAVPNSPPRGFLFHSLMVLRRKATAKKKKEDAKKHLKGHETKKESQEIKYTVSEMKKAEEEVLNQLNEVWKEMSSFYCHEDADLQKAGTDDGQKTSLRSPGTIVSEGVVGNTDSTASNDDCVVSKDEADNIDEEDGLTVVAFEDYCNLKHENDTLREQIEREKELRQIAEKKLAEVEAEKLALEKEIVDFKARGASTRWKHNTVEYCRKSYER